MLDDFFILIGRFHPLIVHLPIGFIVLGILIGLLEKAKTTKQEFYQTV